MIVHDEVAMLVEIYCSVMVLAWGGCPDGADRIGLD